MRNIKKNNVKYRSVTQIRTYGSASICFLIKYSLLADKSHQQILLLDKHFRWKSFCQFNLNKDSFTSFLACDAYVCVLVDVVGGERQTVKLTEESSETSLHAPIFTREIRSEKNVPRDLIKSRLEMEMEFNGSDFWLLFMHHYLFSRWKEISSAVKISSFWSCSDFLFARFINVANFREFSFCNQPT